MIRPAGAFDPSSLVRCVLRISPRALDDVLRVSIGRIRDGSATELQAVSTWSTKLSVVSPGLASELVRYPQALEDLTFTMELVLHRENHIRVTGYPPEVGFDARKVERFIDWVARLG